CQPLARRADGSHVGRHRADPAHRRRREAGGRGCGAPAWRRACPDRPRAAAAAPVTAAQGTDGMTSSHLGPSPSDVEILRRLDPGNTEHWTPVHPEHMSGWTFRLTPPFAGQRPFVFFAFRSPSDGNAFRIAPLEPIMDTAYGHAPHMIRIHVGGRAIPVIC